MVLFKKFPMQFDGKNYEIRVLYAPIAINVAAFYNNYPVNGFRYQIKVSKGMDIEKMLTTDAVKELVDLSKKDITENRWVKLLQSLA